MNSLTGWVEAQTGHAPCDPALFERALTHSSRGGADYERLEFLGDRVLGLCVAAWLYRDFAAEPEGKLSQRLNVLVSRETCAEVGRSIGLPAQARLGRQALDDGAQDSDNVLGDMIEALLGALYLEGGIEAASAFVRRHWEAHLDRQVSAPKHPKSYLQEWAAAHNRRPPEYELVERSGPQHAPRFEVRVTIHGLGDASAYGTSKQEAEKAAAEAMLDQIEASAPKAVRR
jgi:ribonuclease-3